MGRPLLPRGMGGPPCTEALEEKEAEGKGKRKRGKSEQRRQKGPPTPSEARAGEGGLGGELLQAKPVHKGVTAQSSRGGRHTGAAGRGGGGSQQALGQSRGQRLGSIRRRGLTNEQTQSGRRWVPTAYLKPQLGHVSHQPVPTGFLLRLQGETGARPGTKSWGHRPSPVIKSSHALSETSSRVGDRKASHEVSSPAPTK